MSQNINNRLDKLEEEIKCIIEVRKVDKALEVFKQKCNRCNCQCCTCKKSSASSSPSRGTKHNANICKSKSDHVSSIGSRRFSRAPLKFKKSKKGVSSTKENIPCRCVRKEKKQHSHIENLRMGVNNEIQVLHEYKRKFRNKLPAPTNKVRSRSPSPQEASILAPNLTGNGCDPKRCSQVETITKNLKTELEIMKNQINHLEESKMLALETTRKIKQKYENIINDTKPSSKTDGSRDSSVDSKINAKTKGSKPKDQHLRNKSLEQKSEKEGNEGKPKKIRNKSVSSQSDKEDVVKNSNVLPSKLPTEKNTKVSNDKNNKRYFENKENENTKTLEILTNKINEKDKNIKSLSDTNTNLLKSIMEKNKEIKMLQDTIKTQEASCKCLSKAIGDLKDTLQDKDAKCEKLAECLNEKDAQCKTSNKTAENLKTDLKQSDMKVRRLSKINSGIEASLQTWKNKYEEVLKQLSGALSKNKECEKEIDKVNEQLKNNFDLHNIDLENQLNNSRVRKNELLKEIDVLKSKVHRLESMNIGLRKVSDHELQTLVAQNNALQENYDGILRKLQQYEAEDITRARCVESELNFIKNTMSESERALISEKEELKLLIQDLTNIIKEQKTRIDEVLEYNHQQEDLLKTQTNIILDKDEQLKHAAAETTALKCKCEHIQKEAELLQRSLKQAGGFSSQHQIPFNAHQCSAMIQKRMSDLVEDLERTKFTLDEERDKVLLKDKIIDDQSKTVEILKMKLNEKVDDINRGNDELRRAAIEIKRFCEEVSELQSAFERERCDKRALENDILNLEWHKEQLKNRVDELENNLITHCDCSKDLTTKQQRIESLQNQILAEQREWEEKYDILTQEKNTAINAAKFATQKLLDTVHDFQKQVETQQKIQRVLTNVLHDKDEKIKTTVRQMSSMTLELANPRRCAQLTNSKDAIPYDHENWGITSCSCDTETATSSASEYVTPSSMITIPNRPIEFPQRHQHNHPPNISGSGTYKSLSSSNRLKQQYSSAMTTAYVEVDFDTIRHAKEMYDAYLKMQRPLTHSQTLYFTEQDQIAYGHRPAPPMYDPYYNPNQPVLDNAYSDSDFYGGPMVEEACTKTTYGPPNKRNMYWPPVNNTDERNTPYKRYEQCYNDTTTPYDLPIYNRFAPIENQVTDRDEISSSHQEIVHETFHKPNLPHYTRRNMHYPPPD